MALLGLTSAQRLNTQVRQCHHVSGGVPPCVELCRLERRGQVGLLSGQVRREHPENRGGAPVRASVATGFAYTARVNLGLLDTADPGDHLERRDRDLQACRTVRQDALVLRRNGESEPLLEVRGLVSQVCEPASGQREQGVGGLAVDPGDGIEPPLQGRQPASGSQLGEPPEHHVRRQLGVTGGQRVAHRRLVATVELVPFDGAPVQAGWFIGYDGRELCLEELREERVVLDQAVTVLRHDEGVARPHQPS